MCCVGNERGTITAKKRRLFIPVLTAIAAALATACKDGHFVALFLHAKLHFQHYRVERLAMDGRKIKQVTFAFQVRKCNRPVYDCALC